MSQFTLRDAVSSRVFLVFGKSAELGRAGSEIRNVFSNIRCLDCQPTETLHDEPLNPIRSDTGQLAWWRSEGKGGLVTIDTDRTAALVGFVRDNGGYTSHPKPLGETRGRRLEMGWEIAIGEKPATSYLIRIVR
jgi:hypothetical protein